MQQIAATDIVDKIYALTLDFYEAMFKHKENPLWPVLHQFFHTFLFVMVKLMIIVLWWS